MLRFLLCLIVTLALVPDKIGFAADEVAAVANEGTPLPPDVPVADTVTTQKSMADAKADPAYGVKYTQEQVVNLPQDQNKFYTTVIGAPGDSKFDAVKGWFNNVPELKSVRSQTHFNVIETTSTMFKERYAKTVKTTPCIRIQAADGTILYQCSGDNVPMSGEALTKAINTECLRRWRQKQNAGPEPDTTPAPTPDGDTPPDTTPPDTTPDTEPDTTPDTIADEAYRFPWVMVLSTFAGGIFIGAGSMVVTLHRKKYLAPPPK